MTVRLSRHARDELRRRSIPEHVLDAVLDHPQQVVPAERGRRVYQSKVDFGAGKTFLVRVVVAEAGGQPVVITAYRTSKIGKYWRP